MVALPSEALFARSWARLCAAGGALLAVLSLFVPWVTFESRFGNLVVAPPAGVWALREWGMILDVAAMIALALRLRRPAPDPAVARRLAYLMVGVGLLTFVEVLAVAARVHGGVLGLPDAGMSIGFYLGAAAALLFTAAGAAARFLE